jgi:hypothetical protein
MVRVEVVSGNGGIEAVALEHGARLSIELTPSGEEMLLVFDRSGERVGAFRTDRLVSAAVERRPEEAVPHLQRLGA